MEAAVQQFEAACQRLQADPMVRLRVTISLTLTTITTIPSLLTKAWPVRRSSSSVDGGRTNLSSCPASQSLA
jgi:hypothetical protein